ncbi:MAG: phosphatase PAP2 family protein [Rhodospirillaceae bacterium]|nr:phosphatase PAP2 family protein [Rhodospirillaceae bacterium]
MAVPLKKMVRDTPAGFDIRTLPARALGAIVGALKGLFRISTLATIVVALALIAVAYLYVDRPLALWLHKFDQSVLTKFFAAITKFGSASVLLALPLLAAGALFIASLALRQSARFQALQRGSGQAFFVFCCVAAPAAVGMVAKILVGRARPTLLFESNTFGFTPMSFNYEWHSMPSGHSLAAAGFAAGLALVMPLPAFPLVAFFGAMIAFSRVATSAHFFGDALAGGMLAIVCAIVMKGAFRGAGFKKLFPNWDPNRKLRLRSISRVFTRRN